MKWDDCKIWIVRCIMVYMAFAGAFTAYCGAHVQFIQGKATWWMKYAMAGGWFCFCMLVCVLYGRRRGPRKRRWAG